MFAQNAQSKAPTENGFLAPVWHTGLLIALIVSVAVLGTALGGKAAPTPDSAAHSRVFVVYLPLVLVQWGLAYYVSFFGRARHALLHLLGDHWENSRRAFTDIALALSAAAIIEGSALLGGRLLGLAREASNVAVLPNGPTERIIWTFVAVNVGVCEELVYRGYLQTQLTAFSRSAVLGVALQAALFAIAHGDQGGLAMVQIAWFGLVLGILARWRGTLLPGILCHVGVDVAAGWIGP